MIIILTAFTYKLNAQSGGLNLAVGFPMGEFKDNVHRVGIGGSAQLLFWSPSEKMPYSFGIDIGYLNYGSESRREPFSYTIPDVTVDVNRTNNLVNFHLLFQIAPPKGDVRPYLDLLFGGAYMFTETQINSSGNKDVASSTNFDDYAWSYGAGVGFLISLGSPIDFGDRQGSLFLDIKARYLYGTEAEYLKEGSVKIINNRAYYDVTKSKTDLLVASIGIVANF